MSLKKPKNTYMDKCLTRPAVRIVAAVLLAAGVLQLAAAQEKANTATPETVDTRLAAVKRVCIQSFGNDVLGIQVQEMVIAKLFQSKKLSLTENCEKADFVLKGFITESRAQFSRSESEGIGFGQRAAASTSSSSRSGSIANGSSSAASGALSGNAHESLSSSEVKQQAAVTMRITDKDGEIIWATSQESAEGKAKSAIGLAADQAVRRLLRDIEKAEKQTKSDNPQSEKANRP